MDSSSFMAIRSLFFKYLLSLLVIARFVEQEWDGQFYAQWGGRAVGGPTVYGCLRYRHTPNDKSLRARFPDVTHP